MFDLSFLKKSVAALTQERTKLLQAIEQLQREREDILTAPATREDIKAMVSTWCADRAGKYRAQLFTALSPFIRKPKLAHSDNGLNVFTLFGAQGSQLAGPVLSDMAICALFGPALVKAVHESIDAMQDWPANALPWKGRTERVEGIDKKLADLIANEADIVAQARSAGIIFE
jgi:hypothetical protein